ncbi:MAG: IS701 family transposase [Chloroflexi bacterium]|nr:IS701 family transposase [Chloroflexota bacterium]
MSAPTVELGADVLERLHDYVAELAEGFDRITRHYWAGVYLQGLLLDGERKSMQPLAQRVSVPGWHGDTMQALQQFITDSTWDEQAVLWAYRHVMQRWLVDRAGVIVIDATGFAKKGRHSVGVARQYSGTLGKTDNCQVAVSLHYCAPLGDYPLALRLYLPESWTSQPERMQAVRVPPAHQTARTKEQIALELLDQVRSEGLRNQAVIADAGYGLSFEFRRGLEERGERYVVGVPGKEVVVREPPRWGVRPDSHRGRPPERWYVADQTSTPVAVKHLAETLERTPLSWRVGTNGQLHAEFAWQRVWPAHRWQHGRAADDVPDFDAEARWLLVEWRSDGSIRYALSNLPAGTPMAHAVELWKSRWHVEQGYQQLKEELGLDHFEGRSWPGFHHHATMCFLAYGFLQLEQLRATPPTPKVVVKEPARPFRT